ncbi:MAG: twin-arginine translocase subunit TatC [Betaproteobacteria bacterium]|nr:twin-arginine translocase subunit TatC [Betaproteobacteria bacterium]
MKILDTISTVFNKGVARKAARQRAVETAAAGVVPHVIEPAPGEMSIVAHISDLRRHIVRAVYWYLALVVLAFINMKALIRFLQLPYTCYNYLIAQANQAGESLQVALQKFADFVSWPTQCLSAAAAATASAQTLKTIGLIEVMWVNLKMCMLVAGVLGLPLILRELWLFVSPALFERERQVAKTLIVSSLLLFYIGIFFGFFVIVPAFLAQTLQWAAEYASVEMTYENYFGSLTTLVMIFGVVFQVPVIISLLGLVGVVKSHHITDNRKFVFFGAFVLGALISPPDVFSQTLVSVPLYLMCEISVFALRAIEKSRAKAAAEAEAAAQNTAVTTTDNP